MPQQMRINPFFDPREAILFSFEPAHLPAEIYFPPFRLSKPSGQNYSRLDAWQWVCRQRHGGLLGSDFSIAEERICGGSLITFCSAALATKSEFSSSAITIDIHLLDPDVDRSYSRVRRVSPGVDLDF
jgi:hypothetical protein